MKEIGCNFSEKWPTRGIAGCFRKNWIFIYLYLFIVLIFNLTNQGEEIFFLIGKKRNNRWRHQKQFREQQLTVNSYLTPWLLINFKTLYSSLLHLSSPHQHLLTLPSLVQVHQGGPHGRHPQLPRVCFCIQLFWDGYWLRSNHVA